MYSHGLPLSLFLSTALAFPQLNIRPAPRQANPNPLDPWVTVDASGTPKTITPISTTISGTPTLLSAAPNALTATILTNTNMGDVRTTTQSQPSQPTAASSSEGAFPVCKNPSGPTAPFCRPQTGDALNPGTTYYITWDPSFFLSAPAVRRDNSSLSLAGQSNTTVLITGSFINATTGEATSQAFSSPPIAAGWGFYAWSVDANAHMLPAGSATNVSLAIHGLTAQSPNTKVTTAGPVVVVKHPDPYRPVDPPAPTPMALYVGLPAVLGFVVIMLCGLYIWHRKTRRIALGNVMTRARNRVAGLGVGKGRGYVGRKERSERMRREKDEGIRLMDRPVGQRSADVSPVGRDNGPYGRYTDDATGGNTVLFENNGWERDTPRRDSDALGSLAGSPTENTFRDEIRRQERER